MPSDQRSSWDGDFGESYTDRSTHSVDEMDSLYKKRFGVSRTELNREFLDHLDRDCKILEVGSNVGKQLAGLKKLGFSNLYGIDIQQNAVAIAHEDRPGLNIIQGDATDIPFKDGFFDLVFTSGVLIHIPPDEIRSAMAEILRCSNQWVLGYEYYADKYTEIEYRGEDGLLWKADFSKLYQHVGEVKLVDERKLRYSDSDNVDAVYLLTKESKARA